MKRIINLLLICLFAFVFISCGDDIYKDNCGCYTSLENVKAVAKEQNKNILVIITDKGEDQSSEFFIDKILVNSKFKKALKSDYLIYHFDYSKEAFEKMTSKDDADEKEKQRASRWTKIMEEGYQFASYISLEYTPSLYIITKDGYVVSEVKYNDDTNTPDAFVEMINFHTAECDTINKQAERIALATDPMRKLEAIDDLYVTTPVSYRVFLTDLVHEAVKIDPENKSGKMGKYFFAIVEMQAAELYRENDIEGAIQKCIEAAENNKISDEDQQQSYYLAAWLLQNSGSNDNAQIIDYLQKAVQKAPDSEYANIIQQFMEQMIVQQKEQVQQ